VFFYIGAQRLTMAVSKCVYGVGQVV